MGAASRQSASDDECFEVLAFTGNGHIWSYDEEATLTTRNASQVTAWIATLQMMAQGATTFHLFNMELDMSWYYALVLRQHLQGIKKRRTQWMAGSLVTRRTLDDNLVMSLVKVSDAMDNDEFSVFLLAALAFWARVQSETIPLMKGAIEDLDTLPVGVHSALVVHNNSDTMIIR